jgi:hypothetical protein
MGKKHEPLPNFNSDEVGFNVKATRGYLFSAATHVLEGMHEQKIEHAAAAVMTGSVEFAALLWMQTALKSRIPRGQAMATARREFETFLRKHGKEIYEQPEEAVQ